jgi:tyrosine-protein kinase Etk/Wzc
MTMLHEASLHQGAIQEPETVIGDETPLETPKVEAAAVFLLLLRGKKTILRWMTGTFLLSVVLAFFVLKPKFTGEALFIPPQTSPGSAMAQLSGQLGSLGAIGALGGLKNPGDIYLGILQSRTVADDIISRFHLQEVYKVKKISDAEKSLKAHAKFVAGKDSLIRISVDDSDPKRAADIANGFLDELQHQNGRLALTEASQRRLFFEQQLERQKDALADAEVNLQKTQEGTGLIAPNSQAQVEIETMANLRAEITNREIQLSAVRQGATDLNPDVTRLQAQISGLQQQIQKLQSDTMKSQPGDTQLPTAKVPEFALEYIRKQREVKYHEALFELLARQYEAARVDESRQAPVLQIVDSAVVPDKKSGPPRALIVLAGSLLGAVLGSATVLLRHFVESLKADPSNKKRFQTLRDAASFGR